MLPSTPNEPNPGLERVGYALRAGGIKDVGHNPLRSGVHSRGYLPHVKREGASYFVTFRLADALPKEVLLKFEREKAERLRLLVEAERQGWSTTDSEEEINRDLRRRIERYLDKGHGACHLGRTEIADFQVGSPSDYARARHCRSSAFGGGLGRPGRAGWFQRSQVWRPAIRQTRRSALPRMVLRRSVRSMRKVGAEVKVSGKD